MAEMSFEEFNIDWRDFANEHPEYRLGQALFNYLWKIDAHLSDLLSESPYDPFYADSSIIDALEFLKEHWDD